MKTKPSFWHYQNPGCQIGCQILSKFGSKGELKSKKKNHDLTRKFVKLQMLVTQTFLRGRKPNCGIISHDLSSKNASEIIPYKHQRKKLTVHCNFIIHAHVKLNNLQPLMFSH
jgi:hypothetical protein